MDISTVQKTIYAIKLENVSSKTDKEAFELLYGKNFTPQSGEKGDIKDLPKRIRETIHNYFGYGFISYQIESVASLSEDKNRGGGEIVLFTG